MATPNVGILTTTGKALIDKVNSGQAKISFSKVVFSSMDNSQLSDTQIKALTAIAPQEVVVSSPQTTLDTNSGETRIRATGTNEKLADGVYVKTYGVFAKDDTGNEILYGVTVSPNPNYFPAYDGVTPQAVTYSYKTVIQETSNITMTNSNDVYVSQEDLTEAIAKIPQPDLSGYDKTDDVDKKLQNKQDKLGYTAADDSKVVHDNGNGTIQVNGTQVNPYNKLTDSVGGRNLLPVSNYTSGYVNKDDGTVTPAGATTKEVVSNFVSVDAAQNYFFQVIQQVNANLAWIGIGFYDANEQFISRYENGWTPVTGTITTVVSIFPIGSPNVSIPNVSTTVCPKNTAYVRISFSTYGAPIQASLEKTSILNDWTPAPEDKVNVSDMRKPASDVAGIEEVNTKADDSKVAHLSGANDFDTVPTVNNNPLLLASSLPSDLARTGQDANFTAKLQQNDQDVALANNTIARNPNTGVVSEPVDFTKLTVNGGKSVATSDDLNNYYHANASDDAALAAAKVATVPGIFWFEEV
ncbi:hypothetical protein DA477_12695 [Levilactobacillus brevis]|uniref:hypothetical protein n=1 Tax=Levilactobacillus brevis TaxID=1580 RepID=UPI000D37208A|nr:hypothetical protein [Levilactobacillus brevis]PUD95468.1 hypothetical protein DA477_12695 [Levilactobacillus brevis]